MSALRVCLAQRESVMNNVEANLITIEQTLSGALLRSNAE
jgi:hypothetical protein